MPNSTCPHCNRTTSLKPFDYLCDHCGMPVNQSKDPSYNFGDMANKPTEYDNGGFNFGDGGAKTEYDATFYPNKSGGNEVNPFDKPTELENKPQKQRSNPFDNSSAFMKDIPAGGKVSPPVAIPKFDNEQKKGMKAIAWLVVHTEGEAPITYDLFEGDNFFGRAAENYAVDVPVKNDNYVSRAHACVRIRKDEIGRFSFELLDQGIRRNGQVSTNGTYINGRETRLAENNCIFLKDDDTIQVGFTKLVFKSTAKNYQEAATQVLQKKDYEKTVFFAKPN